MKPPINQKKENGELFTRKAYKDYTKKRCKELNRINNLPQGFEKYKSMNVNISEQPDDVKTLDFIGIKSTQWLRTVFNQKTCIEWINLITPYEETRLRKMITKDRLKEFKITKRRKKKSRIIATDAEKNKDKKLQKMKKRLDESNRKNRWRNTYSNFFQNRISFYKYWK